MPPRCLISCGKLTNIKVFVEAAFQDLSARGFPFLAYPPVIHVKLIAKAPNSTRATTLPSWKAAELSAEDA